jgi:hypothetical protein
VAGFGRLVGTLSQHGDDPAGIEVAMETDRGLLVAALSAAGYRVFAVSPRSVDRHRDRYGTSGAKSDPGDALVLANLLRTDKPMHRPIAADSPDAQVLGVLARAHQDTVRHLMRDASRLRAVRRSLACAPCVLPLSDAHDHHASSAPLVTLSTGTDMGGRNLHNEQIISRVLVVSPASTRSAAGHPSWSTPEILPTPKPSAVAIPLSTP